MKNVYVKYLIGNSVLETKLEIDDDDDRSAIRKAESQVNLRWENKDFGGFKIMPNFIVSVVQ